MLVLFVLAISPADQGAKEIYMRGERQYSEGNYEAAAQLFHEAWELSKRPVLLYNLSLTYENLGQYERAAEYLRQYLPEAPVQQRPALEARARRMELRADKERIAKAQKQLAEETARLSEQRLRLEEERAKQAELQEAKTQLDRRARELEEEERRVAARERVPQVAAPLPSPDWPGYLLAGAGTVAIGFGVYAGQALSDANVRVKDLCPGVCKAGGEDAKRDPKKYALWTDVGYGAGGALLAAGVLYLLWPEQSVVAVHARADSARVVVTFPW
jgi:tetratricopeptide (TPR) repeat protein